MPSYTMINLFERELFEPIVGLILVQHFVCDTLGTLTPAKIRREAESLVGLPDMTLETQTRRAFITSVVASALIVLVKAIDDADGFVPELSVDDLIATLTHLADTDADADTNDANANADFDDANADADTNNANADSE